MTIDQKLDAVLTAYNTSTVTHGIDAEYILKQSALGITIEDCSLLILQLEKDGNITWAQHTEKGGVSTKKAYFHKNITGARFMGRKGYVGQTRRTWWKEAYHVGAAIALGVNTAILLVLAVYTTFMK